MQSVLAVAVVFLLSIPVFAHERLEIVISPANPTIDIGGTVQLEAIREEKKEEKGTNEDSDLKKHVRWSSSDPAIATVSTGGLVTGIASGTVVIHARIRHTPFEASTEVTVRSKNFFVYVLNTASSEVSGFSNLPGGSLSPLSSFPLALAAEPFRMAADPGGKFAYVTDYATNQVFGYQINSSSGGFTPVPGSPLFTDGNQPLAALVDPAGAHLYVANSSSNNIAIFQIGANGSLTELGGSPVAAGNLVEDIAMDRRGKFLYATNFFDNTLSAFTVNADGSLTPIAGSPYPTPSNPSTVTVDPLDRFVFVTSLGTEAISTFQMNSTTGALTPGPVLSLSNSSFYVTVIDPTGRFAYVANQSANNIGGYNIDASTGALQPLPGSPFAGVQFPYSIAMDKSGSFVYVSNELQNSVSGLAVDSNTGALTPVTGSPFPVGTTPFSVTVVPRP